MRILITGASGFVGGHAATRLAAAGHQVIGTGRDAAKLAAVVLPGGERVAADLTCDDLGLLVRGCDAVIHSAALAAPWGPREEFQRHNVTATERLLEASKAAGSVRRFVHVSTPSIYFQSRDRIGIHEEFTPPAQWPTFYAESKWQAEVRVRAPEYRMLGPVILRPRAVFGAGDTAIVPRLLKVARRGMFPLAGGGNAHIDVTCVDNLVDAIELALAAPRALEGRAFNITNGEPVTVKTLVENLFEAIGLEVRLMSVPLGLLSALATLSEFGANLVPGRPEPRLTRYGVGLLGYSQTLSIDAARNDLGYSPRINTRDGLRLHAPWYRAHG
jgi:nucleoside-diphosphate-sugar epimerase